MFIISQKGLKWEHFFEYRRSNVGIWLTYRGMQCDSEVLTTHIWLAELVSHLSSCFTGASTDSIKLERKRWKKCACVPFHFLVSSSGAPEADYPDKNAEKAAQHKGPHCTPSIWHSDQTTKCVQAETSCFRSFLTTVTPYNDFFTVTDWKQFGIFMLRYNFISWVQ